MSVLASLEASLELSEVSRGVFEGPNVELPGYGRLFGGQLLAQAIAAARRSDPGGKRPRSVHLVFSAEGRPGTPVSWAVSRVHDGRRFATRSVEARQGDRVLASGVVSLAQPIAGGGPSHADAPPEWAGQPSEATPVPPMGAMALELRSAGGVALDARDVGPPRLAVWTRRPAGSRDRGLDAELLAYSSDLTMMSAALRPHEGLGFGSPLLAASAVTSHAVSFHREFVLDDWLLFAQVSPVASGGLAYVRGDWFTPEGDLVASCTEEVYLEVARGRQ